METVILSNGLRLLCIHNDRPTVYCGIMMGSGTRHELPSECGMAHCVEHMSFKGTERRSAMQIINRMESVGGDINAFTTKQETVYYSICLKEHMSRALDLLMDIVFHSTYPEDALEREVEVIIDEIESYNDSPSELIFDDFENVLFKSHSLGRSILGDAESLRSFTSADLHRFTNRLYDPSRAVLFVMGDVKISDIIRCLKCDISEVNQFVNSRLSESSGQVTKSIETSEYIVRDKQTHQAHVVVGCEAITFNDDRFMGLFLLNNILGGVGMNSRLNVALREKRGLVYTVESSLLTYIDTGVWNVYMGCDVSDIKKCLGIVKKELQRLIDKPMSNSMLKSAVQQLKGQIAISHDNFESVAIGTAKRLLYTGKVQTLEEMFAELDALTPESLHQIATEFLNPDRMTTLIYK
ncbi:MAG: insulinase family protein [Bacteroidaceae bacterium]|nr:insulinase family protein [Bacteroidaceae bacterium]